MKKGATRWVFFIGKFAFKFPSFSGWKQFLWGLLANIQEKEFSKVDVLKNKLCPVIFSFPFGFLVVMPKAKILERDEISKEHLKTFCTCGEFMIPSELKYDSFGYLNGKLVSVDYGS